jgi:hypothetical protein
VCYYFLASLVGYRAFGNAVDENILVTLRKPKWLAHRPRQHDGCRPSHRQLLCLGGMEPSMDSDCGRWQVYAMLVFHMTETVLVKKLGFRPSLALRLVARPEC